ICGWVLEQGRSQRIAELTQDPRHVPWHATSRSALVVPLINGSERIGVINVESGRPAAFSAGDEPTLETIAPQLAAARGRARRHRIVARYGGDEFAVILPETAVAEARQLVERLQTRLLASRTTSDDLAIGPLTVSVGLAVYPADGTRAAALVAAADSRMYQQ